MDFIRTKGQGPKRLEVEMLDPIMFPGEAQTGIAPITVTPSGLSCEAELWLGPTAATKSATSGKIAFSSTGAAQSVRFPITMPAGGATYHVYVDCYVEGILLVAYIATEDVIIPSATVGPIIWE